MSVHCVMSAHHVIMNLIHGAVRLLLNFPVNAMCVQKPTGDKIGILYTSIKNVFWDAKDSEIWILCSINFMLGILKLLHLEIDLFSKAVTKTQFINHPKQALL